MLELLLIDSWLEPDTLIFSNARSSSLRFFFSFSGLPLTCFYTITFTSCLVYLFFFWKCFSVFYFVCLTSVFNKVHSFVVCLYVPWYKQNFLPLYSSSESLSLESLKVTNFSLGFLPISWRNKTVLSFKGASLSTFACIGFDHNKHR